MSFQLNQAQIDEAMSFHGHCCPGLASGIRKAGWTLTEFDAKFLDDQLVAVVETDRCDVDAIRFLPGHTFGKGNLVHKEQKE
jgi:formylmethanofuran dehydrogenase subunit E